MCTTIHKLCTALISVILVATVVDGRRGMTGEYTLIAKDPSLTFCTKQLLLEGAGNVLTRMAFNGNDTICNGGSITMVAKRRNYSYSAHSAHFRHSDNLGTSEQRSFPVVRLRSTVRFPCGVEMFRLIYRRYPRGSGIQVFRDEATYLYRKVMTLRTGGRNGPTCIYARRRQVIIPATVSASPSPTTRRTPSPRPYPTVAPPVRVKGNREALGLGLAIFFGVVAGIALTVTLVYCTPLFNVVKSMKKEALFGTAVTIICTIAAIIAEVLT